MSSPESLRVQNSPETPQMFLASRMGNICATRARGILPTRRLSKPIPSSIRAMAYNGESGDGRDDIVVEPRPCRYSVYRLVMSVGVSLSCVHFLMMATPSWYRVVLVGSVQQVMCSVSSLGLLQLGHLFLTDLFHLD